MSSSSTNSFVTIEPSSSTAAAAEQIASADRPPEQGVAGEDDSSVPLDTGSTTDPGVCPGVWSTVTAISPRSSLSPSSVQLDDLAWFAKNADTARFPNPSTSDCALPAHAEIHDRIGEHRTGLRGGCRHGQPYVSATFCADQM